MTTLILPGLYGSGPGHWQRIWTRLVPDAVLVAQDDWVRPDRDRWIARAVAAIQRHPNAVLVGHSLGAVLIAHVAAAAPDLPIAAALLVAPADVEAPRAALAGLADFAPLPAAPLPFRSILVASRNDPWMSVERARIHANLWESAFVDAGALGHINAESHLGAWRPGLDLLARLHGAAARPTRTDPRIVGSFRPRAVPAIG